MMAIFH